MKRNPTFLIGLLVAMLGMLVAMMSVTNGLTMSTTAYATKPDRFKYCYTTTATSGILGACLQTLPNCKKSEQDAIANGYTIAQECHKVKS
jgi:hypothetical protein